MCASPFNTENPAYIIIYICYDSPSPSSVCVVLATWTDDGDKESLLNLRLKVVVSFLTWLSGVHIFTLLSVYHSFNPWFPRWPIDTLYSLGMVNCIELILCDR